jgi:ABC-type glycerol-3-phosphate transport system substrate-binding protein
MTARFAAHNPPDVFYVDSSIAAAWMQAGVRRAAERYIQKSKYDTSKFYPACSTRSRSGRPTTASRRTGRHSPSRSTRRCSRRPG